MSDQNEFSVLAPQDPPPQRGEQTSTLTRPENAEIEVEALRQEMREWQTRRIALAVLAPGFASAVAAAVLSAELALDTRATIWATVLLVLAVIAGLTWYCTDATSLLRGYFAEYHSGFLWEARLKSLRAKPSLNELLLASHATLGAFVLGLAVPSSADITKNAFFLAGVTIVWGVAIVLLGTSMVEPKANQWSKSSDDPREVPLTASKYDALELKSLRNEMRDWQGRRFLLLAGASTLVSASMAVALKIKNGCELAYPLGMIGVMVFFALTRYAHAANVRCLSYIKKFHCEYQWEVRLAKLKRRSNLHLGLTISYVVLLGLLLVAWGLQTGNTRSMRCRAAMMMFVAGPLWWLSRSKKPSWNEAQTDEPSKVATSSESANA